MCIQKILNNGLVNEIDIDEFSSESCALCNAKAGKRYKFEGYIDLAHARLGPGELHSFCLCEDCRDKNFC